MYQAKDNDILRDLRQDTMTQVAVIAGLTAWLSLLLSGLFMPITPISAVPLWLVFEGVWYCYLVQTVQFAVEHLRFSDRDGCLQYPGRDRLFSAGVALSIANHSYRGEYPAASPRSAGNYGYAVAGNADHSEYESVVPGQSSTAVITLVVAAIRWLCRL